MSVKKIVVLFSIVLTVNWGLFSQEQLQVQGGVTALQKFGLLVAHRTSMAHLAEENIRAFECGYTFPMHYKKSWHQLYKNPAVSINFYGSNLGNDAVLGRAYGSYASIAFPFVQSKNHFLTGRLGAGLGYLTKHFDQEKNPKSIAIGTHVNALIQLGLRGWVKIAPRHHLLYQFDITHFSNGAYRVPNLGLNMFFMGAGYSFQLNNKRRLVHVREVEQARYTGWVGNVVGIYSHKEIYPSGRGGKPVYALSFFSRQIGNKKAGVEFALDVMSKQILFDYRPYIPKTQWSILQIGGYCGYVLPLDQLQFVIGMGMYLKDRYNSDDLFYHRVGMRYFFKNGVSANLILKSHWAKADYVEYGIGYNFKLKRTRK